MVVLAHIVLPPVALDSFTIASVLLAVVGTLYLAYDLLGRQHGPLQWLTLVITCGLVSALVLGFVATIIYFLTYHSFSFTLTLQILVLGGLMGVFTVVLVDFPKSKDKPPIVSLKRSAIGLALGLIFFFSILLLNPPNNAVHIALALGVTCAVLTCLWPYLTWNPSTSPPYVFSRKGFVIGLLLGLLIWSVVFFFITKDIVLSVFIGVPLAFACGGLLSLWRFIHWEAARPQLHVFSRKGFLVGFAIGFIPWLMFNLTQQNYPTFAQLHVSGLLDGLGVMLDILVIVLGAGALALTNAAAGSISQYILWRANMLSLRRLGVIGLVLILLATSLQAVPAVIDLISILGTPK
jgi:hypothetical protein